MEGKQLIAHEPIGVKNVYDFEVPAYHNYVTGGLVHHNTLSAGMELSYHLTGQYPDWWEGRRFLGPTKWWASNTNNETVRDNPQRILMGQGQDWGTGTIPGMAIENVTMSRGFPNLVDTVQIKHRAGGCSHLQFKAYEQGRTKWQGETLTGGIWFDEEPPLEIYSEGITRLAPGGVALFTATPLLGMSEVVCQFYPHPDNADRFLVQMQIEDAGHYTPEERQQRIDGYPAFEREARSKGIPMLGSGRIFPIAAEEIEEEPLESIPSYWPQIIGIDFGYEHPFAAVHAAWDRDADVVHITKTYRESHQTPPIHVAAIKGWGPWIRCAWPHDGTQTQKGEGTTLKYMYERAGLKMMAEHARTRDGNFYVEPGVTDMLTRMQTGKLRVAKHLSDWFAEFHTYHRKQGKIVKEKDDLLDATRCLLMSLWAAKVEHRMEQPATVGMDYSPLEAA